MTAIAATDLTEDDLRAIFRVYWLGESWIEMGHPPREYPEEWDRPIWRASYDAETVYSCYEPSGDVARVAIPPVKDLVRALAGSRCERCRHPYTRGAGQWSPCDSECRHRGPSRMIGPPGDGSLMEAQWRILTVHHLSGEKYDLRWWNLVALCQRCHLNVQGRVVLDRPYALDHSDWFRPYAAGWYAAKYLDEDLTRAETLARLDELLALEGGQTALDIEEGSDHVIEPDLLSMSNSSSTTGFVYFVRRDNLVKIGTSISSSTLPQRIEAALGELLAVERGGRQREAELHIRFQYCRRRGEWFKATRALLGYINDLPEIDY